MHSFLARLNALFTFLSSVLAAATVLVFLQTLFHNYTVPIDVKIENIKLKPIRDYASQTGQSDMATAGFHLYADLTPIFNWNVRFAYVWLQAEYETEERPINQLLIWDKYVKRFESTVLDQKIAKPRYAFVADGDNLRGKNVTFTLHWTVVPNAGWLRIVLDQEGSNSVRLPLEYKCRFLLSDQFRSSFVNLFRMPTPTLRKPTYQNELSESSLRKMEALLKLTQERMERQKLCMDRVKQLRKEQADYVNALPAFVASRVRLNVDEIVAEALGNVSRFVEGLQANKEKKRLAQKLRELKEEEAKALERRQAVQAELKRVTELKEELRLAMQEYAELLKQDRALVQEQIRLNEAVMKAQSCGR